MRFTNLQAGRFAAAGLVLAFHAGFYGHYYLGVADPFRDPPAAYVFRSGVVFFFALSGFVLAHGLQTARFPAFVASRLLRLFPAFWAATLTVLAVRWAAGCPLPFTGKSLAYGLLLWPAGPNRAASFLWVEWTLVYELFFSLAVVWLAVPGRRWGLGVGAAVWLLLCLGKVAWDPHRDVPWSPRLAELPLSVVNVPFILGILVCLTHHRWGRLRAWAVLTAAAALAGGVAFVTSVQSVSYALQGLGCALAVGVLATGRQVEPTHPLAEAGDWSYGVYLIHVPVMAGFFTLVGWRGWFAASPAVVVFGAALALVAGSLFGAAEWAVYRRLRRAMTGWTDPVGRAGRPSYGGHAPGRLNSLSPTETPSRRAG